MNEKLQVYGEKITVACKKGCVFLKNLGQAPFAVVETKRGLAIIPDGYQVSTFSDREWWLAETKVIQLETINTCYYRFVSLRVPDVSSTWRLTPTEAYKEVNEKLDTGFRGGGNGQLIIGCTYPSLQRRILDHFPEAQTLLDKMNTKLVKQTGHQTTGKRNKKSKSNSTIQAETEDFIEIPRIGTKKKRYLTSLDNKEIANDDTSKKVHLLDQEVGDCEPGIPGILNRQLSFASTYQICCKQENSELAHLFVLDSFPIPECYNFSDLHYEREGKPEFDFLLELELMNSKIQSSQESYVTQHCNSCENEEQSFTELLGSEICFD